MLVRAKKNGAILGALALALVLTACSSSGENQVQSALGSVQPGQQAQAGQAATDPVQDLRAYCPKTVMRAGTEKLDLYPPKSKPDEVPPAAALRFRATITEVVRECNYAGDLLNMRVGIAGRIISGPAGETGPLTLPVRVAVTQGDTVLYSQLHDIPAEILLGRTNANFSFVDSAISLPKPDKENIVVYVGFDELREDPAAAKDKKPKKPVN